MAVVALLAALSTSRARHHAVVNGPLHGSKPSAGGPATKPKKKKVGLTLLEYSKLCRKIRARSVLRSSERSAACSACYYVALRASLLSLCTLASKRARNLALHPYCHLSSHIHWRHPSPHQASSTSID